MPVPAAQWDLLGFGAVTVDDVICVDHFPPPDTKAAIVSRQQLSGGVTATALVAAARLGARAAYCGVLGDDERSRFSITELEQAGVDCAPLIRQADARPMEAVVIVERPSGRRSILFSDAAFRQPDETAITEALITSARMLFLDHMAVAVGLRAAPIARAHGVPIVADFERVMTPRLYDLIPQVDHLILNNAMGQALTGETAPDAMVRALAGRRHVCCAITGGERGLWYAERGGAVRHLPAFAVAAVDTTGCGDVLHGAYAAAIIAGASVDEALTLGSAAAALKTRAHGGRAGIPDVPTALRFLKERGMAHAMRAFCGR